jgi:hypothetical protein
VALLLTGCQAPTSPSPPAVLRPGEVAENSCETAVVARAERVRDQGPAGAEQLEADIFSTCTYAEFRAANAKMADGYRYPGDGRSYVGRNCLRVFAPYRGSRLCQTR